MRPDGGLVCSKSLRRERAQGTEAGELGHEVGGKDRQQKAMGGGMPVVQQGPQSGLDRAGCTM